MHAHRIGIGRFLVAGLLLIGSCKSAPPEVSQAGPAGSLCKDLAQLHQEIETIRAAAAAAPGGLQGTVGTTDTAAALAKLAELQATFVGDAGAFRDSGQTDVADKVAALASQIDTVVQRNTLEGVGTNDPGSDPTVNIEKRAAEAGSGVACPSPGS